MSSLDPVGRWRVASADADDWSPGRLPALGFGKPEFGSATDFGVIAHARSGSGVRVAWGCLHEGTYGAT
jgi:hypothetical protein